MSFSVIVLYFLGVVEYDPSLNCTVAIATIANSSGVPHSSLGFVVPDNSVVAVLLQEDYSKFLNLCDVWSGELYDCFLELKEVEKADSTFSPLLA